MTDNVTLEQQIEILQRQVAERDRQLAERDQQLSDARRHQNRQNYQQRAGQSNRNQTPFAVGPRFENETRRAALYRRGGTAPLVTDQKLVLETACTEIKPVLPFVPEEKRFTGRAPFLEVCVKFNYDQCSSPHTYHLAENKKREGRQQHQHQQQQQFAQQRKDEKPRIRFHCCWFCYHVLGRVENHLMISCPVIDYIDEHIFDATVKEEAHVQEVVHLHYVPGSVNANAQSMDDNAAGLQDETNGDDNSNSEEVNDDANDDGNDDPDMAGTPSTSTSSGTRKFFEITNPGFPSTQAASSSTGHADVKPVGLQDVGFPPDANPHKTITTNRRVAPKRPPPKDSRDPRKKKR